MINQILGSFSLVLGIYVFSYIKLFRSFLKMPYKNVNILYFSHIILKLILGTTQNRYKIKT